MADLRTGLNTFQALSFAKGRNGSIYFANGVDRPGRWNGVSTPDSSNPEYMGITAPTSGPTVSDVIAVSGGSTAGSYSFAYRFQDGDLPTHTSSSISSFTVLSVSGSRQFYYSGFQQAQTTPTSETARVKYVEIWRTTAGQTRTVYQVIRLGISGTISSTSSAAGDTTFTSTTPHGLAAGAVITISGTTDYNGSRNVKSCPTDYTFTVTVAAGTDPRTGTWVLTGYGTADGADSYTDTQMQARESMLVTNSAGTHSIARRQVPPPWYKPYLCMFQDRLWMAGMLRYSTGTVATTSGSATVTGTGTSWTAGMVGQYMAISGDPVLHLISSVDTGAQTLVIAEKSVTNASGSSYIIKPDDKERVTLWFSEQDEPEYMSSLNTVPIQQNTGSDDEVVGLVESGAQLLILMSRNIYALRYFEQPDIDADVSLLVERGCCNSRTWARFENVLYMMDKTGIWAYQGGSDVQNVGEPIQDLFRDGTISWTNSKYFFAVPDFTEQTVKFYVQFSTDSGTRPRRWLEYNIRTKAWTTGQACAGAGAGCVTLMSGRPRTIVGFDDDNLELTGEGYCDFITAPVSGTANSSSSAGDLRCTAAPFLAAHVGLPLYFYTGTGKGMYGIVSSYTSSSRVGFTVLSGSTSIDSTTKFIIGAISWSAKTGLFTFMDGDGQLPRNLRITYEPTTDATVANYIDVARYLDHNTTAESYEQDSDPGRAVTRTAGASETTLATAKTIYSVISSQMPGIATLDYHGRYDPNGVGRKFVAFNIRGYSAYEAVRVYRIGVSGVDEGEG